ncbi:helix-turn-helix domain-containing protein [Butyrivibrio proteoclasticus]|uniref:helix-turn-helix domain-containing protein n=1 Tax=Butyrivibrio proteoclasticus TaxID=43305 RepID=UPI00047AB006|nr:helix-turn-helix domain-containing protein [Butyrivibrio proteoclasticus]
MNQIYTGKFIASCRKEKGLTQAQLAEKLNITDRAVSKWETGKCMPDSSIMLELCSILGVTVNELLSGERINMNNYEEKVSENLIELKKQNENSFSISKLLAIAFSASIGIAVLVCAISNFAISGSFTWSLIVLASCLFGWAVTIPMILLGKKGIKTSLIMLTALILPYLFILRVLIGVKELFLIGAVMAAISLAFIWVVYAVFTRFMDRKFLATGITFIVALPFMLIINASLWLMIGEPVVDIWDILAAFGAAAVGVAFIIYDRKKVTGDGSN